MRKLTALRRCRFKKHTEEIDEISPLSRPPPPPSIISVEFLSIKCVCGYILLSNQCKCEVVYQRPLVVNENPCGHLINFSDMDLRTLKIFCVVSFLLSVSAAPKFMPGGLHSQDVNDVKVKKYAKLALPTLESLSDPKEDLSLVEILEAHTQVIAGAVYHLKLKVADSRANEKTCDVKIAVPYNGGIPEVYDPSCGNELLSRKQVNFISSVLPDATRTTWEPCDIT
ncbi:unnamed protein product [Bemisia tabaci]|uniref:Cystatin domain-containing protein n=1 Tax=Bemisia tabaci TaxID=7038 RepID=A0A9P0CGI6_BEMTA|nr:unnamed protein product [Bemisia tabaci]